MTATSRYIVGIDLGTTNTALSYVDTDIDKDSRKAEVFYIKQLIAPGEVKALPSLPSFIHLPEEHDFNESMLLLPWQESASNIIVGSLARELASSSPAKTVSSAKSWLCCESVNRTDEILPWTTVPNVRKISPVDASRYYLEHIRDAWNFEMAADDDELKLENQTIVLTVPASFDAAARELTVNAAIEAGLDVRLLEEPQAAFYSWLHETGDNWRDSVSDGDTVLVCDIGGGTTDFSLIAVTDSDGDMQLQRVAVGDHTLLGGDNMDLTLAYCMNAKLKQTQGVELDAGQLTAMTHACRAAKEKLASGESIEESVTILGRGTGLVGGTITETLTRAELDQFLIDGFFPVCAVTDVPAERRKVGLKTFGLDYAADPALTRHMAGFLGKHSFKDAQGFPVLPSAILFNGGATKAEAFTSRIMSVIESWNGSGRPMPDILTENSPDLAVALGAAWYGHTQREGGVRIKAGSPHSYYIGVESPLPAVPGFPPPVEAMCLVNFGMEEGTSAKIDCDGLGLVVGEPTEFSFYYSNIRQEDEPGVRLPGVSGLIEMPPLSVELPVEGNASAIGTLVPVTLQADLNEIGTLSVWCLEKNGDRRWKLEFELRAEQQA